MYDTTVIECVCVEQGDAEGLEVVEFPEQGRPLVDSFPMTYGYSIFGSPSQLSLQMFLTRLLTLMAVVPPMYHPAAILELTILLHHFTAYI